MNKNFIISLHGRSRQKKLNLSQLVSIPRYFVEDKRDIIKTITFLLSFRSCEGIKQQARFQWNDFWWKFVSVTRFLRDFWWR